VYDDWRQPQLQAEAGKRGLSAGGSNDEIKARLEQDDDEKRIAALLGDDTAPPETSPAQPASQPTATPPAAPPEPAATQAEPTPPPHEYTARYECRGELSTGTHEDNRFRAYEQAIRDGYVPRGGLSAVYRSGFETVNGVRHAVYKVTLKKQ
jgi:hypothetical protein